METFALQTHVTNPELQDFEIIDSPTDPPTSHSPIDNWYPCEYVDVDIADDYIICRPGSCNDEINYYKSKQIAHLDKSDTRVSETADGQNKSPRKHGHTDKNQNMSKSTFGYPNDPNFNLWGLDGPFLPHGPVMYPSGLNGAYGFPDGPLEPRPLPFTDAEKPMSPAMSTIVAKPKPTIHGKKPSRSPAIRTSPHYRGLEMGNGQSGNNTSAQLSNALDAALKHLNGRGLETMRGGLPSVRETTDGHRPMKNKKRVSETTPTAGSPKKVKLKQKPRSPAKPSPEASVPAKEHDPTKSKWGGYGSFVARERARREDRERRQREQDAPKEVSSQGKKPDS